MQRPHLETSRRGARPGARRGRREPTRRSRRGMTLIELAVAASATVIGVLGLLQLVVASAGTTTAGREADLAARAARETIERIRAAEFLAIPALYGVAPGGAVPGNAFAVRGLAPDPDDPDGLVGEVVLPTVGEDGLPPRVREDLERPELGLPRDLNGDGRVDGADHAADMRILPVLVRLRWLGATGVSRLEFRTLVAPY